MISIVLPVYNGARYLAQSIQSCLDQTDRDWELIVVDDCSTDTTPGIIAEFAVRDPRVRTVRNTTNLKLPGSLNAGFAQARGQYLTWTSDDNLYKPEALATMRAALSRSSSTGVVYCDYDLIDSEGRVTGTTRVGEPEELWAGNCVGACFLYRREVQERVGGYDEKLFLAEDYDFWLRASLAGRMLALHQSLYLYRFHPASLTETRKTEIGERADEALARSLPRMEWMSPHARIEGALRLVKGAAARRRLAEAARWMVFASRISPLGALAGGAKKLARAFGNTNP